MSKAMAGPTAAKAQSAFRSAARCSCSPSAACRDGRRHDVHRSLTGRSDVARMASFLASRRLAARRRYRPAVCWLAIHQRRLFLDCCFSCWRCFASGIGPPIIADRGDRIRKSWHWEVSWTAASLVGFLGLFVWGAVIYFEIFRHAARRAARCLSSPSNGCGKSSTPAASPKSMCCTSRSAARSGW